MILLQTLQDLEKVLTIREVSIVGVLIFIIIYLMWSINKKDKRLETVMDNHIRDLKDSDKDKIDLIEKSVKMVSDLKEIIHSK
jgi:hypothetical protein